MWFSSRSPLVELAGAENAPTGVVGQIRGMRSRISEPLKRGVRALRPHRAKEATGRRRRHAKAEVGGERRAIVSASGSGALIAAAPRRASHRFPLRLRKARLAPEVSAPEVIVEPTLDAVDVVDAPTTTLTRPELRSRVWALALPAIGEQLLALGVGASDTFLAGHLGIAAQSELGYDRATAVAAVGVASTAVWVVLTAFFAVNVGVTALVARATGAKDRSLAARAAGQGIFMGVVAGAIMLAAAVPLAELITTVLGVSGQVGSLAATFIRIYSIALPATGVASACTAAMRGSGDARRPLLVMLLVNGLNIVASWVLLNGVPELGIAPLGVIGSAIGATTGWTIGACLALYLLTREHPRAPRITLGMIRPNGAVAARILRVGLPSAAEQVVFQVGIVSFLRAVVPLGATVYAANTSINTVESMGTLPGLGFSVATTALVGQALGAGDPDLAVRAVWTAWKPCVLVMGSIGLIAMIVPNIILGIFVADPSVLTAGDVAMRLSLFTLPMSATAFVFIGALRGAGDTKFPVFVRAAGTWGLRLPAASLLIPMFGLPGARMAMALDFTSQAAITFLRFRSGRWRKAKV